MSLRALGSLLTRRFSPRGVPRAQPPRDLGSAVGDGAYGAVAVAALAGLVGILYFKKDTDESAVEVIGEDGRKEMPGKKTIVVADRKDIAEVVDQKDISGACGGETSQEVADKESVTKQDMKARFEDWTRKYDKTYQDEKEKALRFQMFQDTVKFLDSRSPSDKKRLPLEPSYIADWTPQERRGLLACGNSLAEEDEFREHAKSLPTIRKEFLERQAQNRCEAGNHKPTHK